MSAGFALLQRFMRENVGIALEAERRYLIEDRLRAILRDSKIVGLDELGGKLHKEPRSELANAVTDALTINETSFFRDKLLFRALTERLLPALIARRKDQRRLRIWSAGCSTGQEPYSLAMIIDDQMRQHAGWHIEILATDLSRHALDAARRGLYSQFEVQRGLPVQMLLRHFQQKGDLWRINDALRAKITFKTQNLMMPIGDPGLFDIILCRNVLLYFDVATKRRVLANLDAAMAEDGYLVLGAAERVGGLSETLRPAPSEQFVFLSEANKAE